MGTWFNVVKIKWFFRYYQFSQKGKPGRVQVVEAKLKDNLQTSESWRLDNRMGGGSLSLLAAYVTDTVSHILNEQDTRYWHLFFYYTFLDKHLKIYSEFV